MTPKAILLLALVLASSGPVSTAAEATANPDAAAAEKAAAETEAALAAAKAAAEMAAALHQSAEQAAVAKRQQAADAKNLAGESGARELQQVEVNVSAATTVMTHATSAKAAADKALADAKAAALPLQQAYDAAEKAAQEAAKSAEQKRQAAAPAAAKREAAAEAAAALDRARQSEQRALDRVSAFERVLTTATAHKKLTDELLASVTNQVAEAAARSQAAETTAQQAEARAQQAQGDAAKPAAEKDQAAAEAAAKRKAAAEAATTLAQARQDEPHAQSLATAALQRLSDAQTQKKALDAALADAKNQAVAASAANQAAQDSAREFLKLVADSEEAAVQAAAKRNAANEARAALDPKAKASEQAAVRANDAAQALDLAQQRKRLADEDLENLKKRVALARQTHETDEKAARDAEAASGLLKVEVEKAHAAYLAARNLAADKRALANQIKANANFEASEKAAKEAEAALAPLRAAMQQADKAYADASKTASTKRQQATDAKNLAGEPGAKELKQAEDNVPAAIEALTKATEAKPALDQALAEAKAAASPLQQTYDAAEKLAKEAEAAAKVAADAANKLEDEAKKAAAQATALRRAADTAKTALARVRQNEQQAASQANTAPQKVAEAESQKKAADEALAPLKNHAAAAATAYQAAEQAASDAEASAKTASDDKKPQAVADAAAKRKAADVAKTALAQAQAAQQNPQKLAEAAAQKLARATAQKKLADVTLANVKNQIAAATAALEAAEKAALAAAQTAEEKNQAVAQAAAKRKAAADAAVALAQAQQNESPLKTQAEAAAQKLAEAEAQKKAADAAKAALAQAQQNESPLTTQAEAAAQKLVEAQAQKKAADAAAAAAKSQVAAATAANEAARAAAKELLEIDVANRNAAAQAAARRQAAHEAKAALDPKAKALEQAAIRANEAAQTLERSQQRKHSAEEALENLKMRIASAKQTCEADEKAAREAEAAAVPLKVEAEKTRAAYLAARDLADTKRTEAEQAKAALYRLVAARQVANLTECLDPPKPANRIDEIVFASLKAMGIEPVLCSDAVFVRRAYLDLTGRLPSAEEAKTFILDSEKGKRVALVSRLLDRPEHADYWAMKWSDILRVKAEFPVKIWPNAAQAYHRWVWESIARNKPYDQFARELLTSSGSNFRVGPVNFYRAIQNRTPEGIEAAVALAFMGARVHVWPADRRAGMAAFFSQIGYKPTSEWKEEVVFWDPLHSASIPDSIAPGTDAIDKAVRASNQIPQALPEPLSENGPLIALFPDGTKTTVPPNRDPREVFADWLIRPENPWFAKAIANRTWAWAMGRGIIHEPDDIRDDNPPNNPELLSYLEKELISNAYSLKHLKQLIFTSTAYQFSSVPRSGKPEARAHFASYLLRRVEAEVLIDALNEITGSSDLYTSAVPEPFTYIPHNMSAVALADGSITSSFLTLFGRSSRSTGMEAERVNELASTQWLHLLNSATIQSKLAGGPKLAAILSQGGKPSEIAERLYLTILSRFPTEADVKAAEEYARSGATQGNDVWIDLAWALVNSPEFLLRH